MDLLYRRSEAYRDMLLRQELPCSATECFWHLATVTVTSLLSLSLSPSCLRLNTADHSAATRKPCAQQLDETPSQRQHRHATSAPERTAPRSGCHGGHRPTAPAEYGRIEDCVTRRSCCPQRGRLGAHGRLRRVVLRGVLGDRAVALRGRGARGARRRRGGPPQRKLGRQHRAGAARSGCDLQKPRPIAVLASIVAGAATTNSASDPSLHNIKLRGGDCPCAHRSLSSQGCGCSPSDAPARGASRWISTAPARPSALGRCSTGAGPHPHSALDTVLKPQASCQSASLLHQDGGALALTR